MSEPTKLAQQIDKPKKRRSKSDEFFLGLLAFTVFAAPTLLAVSWPLGFAWRLFRAGAGW